MPFTREHLHGVARSRRGDFESLLRELVEIQSISADPARKGDVEAMAEKSAATIRRFGGHADLHRVAGGNPVVLGGFEDRGPRRRACRVRSGFRQGAASAARRRVSS